MFKKRERQFLFVTKNLTEENALQIESDKEFLQIAFPRIKIANKIKQCSLR
jgi:hypothetical protein